MGGLYKCANQNLCAESQVKYTPIKECHNSTQCSSGCSVNTCWICENMLINMCLFDQIVTAPTSNRWTWVPCKLHTCDFTKFYCRYHAISNPQIITFNLIPSTKQTDDEVKVSTSSVPDTPAGTYCISISFAWHISKSFPK